MADDARGLERSLGSWTPSFTKLVSSEAPELLPWRRLSQGESVGDAPEGTTVLALIFAGGVVMAGDRRATMGSLIAKRNVDKVFPVDDSSTIGVAGTAGIAFEFARLVQVEFEHYEKTEGTLLSLGGKANRISSMIRANLGMAMQGLAVLPLFAGYDRPEGIGKIYSYDVTGGPYEEREFSVVGSGSVFARGALKKLYRTGLSEDEAVAIAVEALYDAADDDSATGGPDLIREIFPTVTVITAEESRRLSEEEVGRFAREVVDRRVGDPGHAAG